MDLKRRKERDSERGFQHSKGNTWIARDCDTKDRRAIIVSKRYAFYAPNEATPRTDGIGIG